MPDYGIKEDQHVIISGSIYLFPSGTLSNPSLARSASIAQVLGVTCSANINNKLTPPTGTSSYSIITINNNNGFTGNAYKIVLRYISGAYNTDGTITHKTPEKYKYKLNESKVRYIDIPIQNNDDSFTVAFKTVNSLVKNGSQNVIYSASLVSDGSSYAAAFSSSLGVNLSVGSSLQIRAGDGLGDLSIGGGFIIDDYTTIGKYLLFNKNSGSVSMANFSGSTVQVGGMMVGKSFKIGGNNQEFSYNLRQGGSGSNNQPFYEGDKILSNASIGITLDPQDKTSGIITGSGDTKLYMSSSGRFGFNTTKPQSDFDIAADKFQVRSKRDSKGIFVNEEGNLESFNKTTVGAATGSEFIMSYARGGAANVTAQMISVVLNGASNPALTGFPASADAQNHTNDIIAEIGGTGDAAENLVNYINSPDIDPEIIAEATHLGEKLGLLGTNAQADDILGSLRWIADSGSFDSKYFDNRGSGEMLKIQGRVSEATDAGIKGDMIFYATTDVAQPPTEIMRIASNGNVHITGSLKVSGTVDSVGVDTDGTSTIDGGSF